MREEKKQPIPAGANGVSRIVPNRDIEATMVTSKKSNKTQPKDDIDRSFLRQAICWAEILEKPVCRRRRERNWR
ncbi:MAG: hypothetical protein IJZ34_08045 [Lachnospiraceae bacterium]|nr:hypothetical protein [Lachnospiraceae bacterium]